MITDEQARACFALLRAPTLRNRYRLHRIADKRGVLVSAAAAVVGRIIHGGKA